MKAVLLAVAAVVLLVAISVLWFDDSIALHSHRASWFLGAVAVSLFAFRLIWRWRQHQRHRRS